MIAWISCCNSLPKHAWYLITQTELCYQYLCQFTMDKWHSTKWYYIICCITLIWASLDRLQSAQQYTRTHDYGLQLITSHKVWLVSDMPRLKAGWSPMTLASSEGSDAVYELPWYLENLPCLRGSHETSPNFENSHNWEILMEDLDLPSAFVLRHIIIDNAVCRIRQGFQHYGHSPDQIIFSNRVPLITFLPH